MIARLALAALVMLAACSPVLDEIRPNFQGLEYFHPYPQPYPGRAIQWTSLDGSTTHVHSAPAIFEPSNTFLDPPGTNVILTVNSNMYDGFGREMPNTLPSTPQTSYNLHDGDVVVSDIDPRCLPSAPLGQIGCFS